MERIKLIQVGLLGGDASSAKAAACLDLDRGAAPEEWAALVRTDRVDELTEQTGAEVIWRRDWDGSRFGDGNGGTVVRTSRNTVEGAGLYAPGLDPA